MVVSCIVCSDGSVWVVLSVSLSGLLALEVKVCSNRWTGESQVVSTATVTPHDPHQQRGVKVHKDGRKCVSAPRPQQVATRVSTVCVCSVCVCVCVCLCVSGHMT